MLAYVYRDGTNNNYSNNHGKEGVGGTLDLVERRRDSIHALLTTGRECCRAAVQPGQGLSLNDI